MDFIDKIRELAARIPKQVALIQTEEATKNAFVMPFISALGYNVFDPTEVTPELHADVGTKKGEKVDYAILKDGKPIMLFECKWHGADLSKEHASQLYRYFSVTEVRFSVLTNGILYWFYTDLDAPNKMDAKPFFEFNMLDIREQDVEELKKFTKSAFDLNGILTTASELKYLREIKRIMGEQMNEPSEDFVKFFASQVYSGRMTQAVREQFTAMTRKALKQFINDQINERLKNALVSDTAVAMEKMPDLPVATNGAATNPTNGATNGTSNGSEPAQGTATTTEEELEGLYIVESILREGVSVKRIVMRDVQSYCGILLDDNNRKPICRLHFNTGQKYVGFFDGDKEVKVAIERIDDLYQHADRLKATVSRYESKAALQKTIA
jgi:predicted type IV restriction endonuclease